MPEKKIAFYDTTLRDGSQGAGVSFSVADKIALCRKFDEFGLDYIEGGWPGSNPKDAEFFAAMKKVRLKRARLAAFGSTRRAKNTPGQDPNLRALAAAKTPVITIFGKAWDLHVKKALRVSLDTNLEMIESSVKYLTKKTDEVFFDAEHFFDGYRENPGYALLALKAAAEGGAKALILCDTNGGSLPDFVAEATRKVAAIFGDLTIGVHCHNDGDLATANTLAAVGAGATQTQGTINGLGERCGNADFITYAAAIALKMAKKSLTKKQLSGLTALSRYVYELANMAAPAQQPYVGDNAFTHKAGVHVSAMAREKRTYEHIAPEVVGNIRRIAVSELSGRSNLAQLDNKTLKQRPEIMGEVLRRVMEYEKEGYTFEAAPATFDLIVWKVAGTREYPFNLESYRLINQTRHHPAGESGNDDSVTEATVKVRIKDQLHHVVSEGAHGPVDALFNGLIKALGGDYPPVKKLKLLDYRVHIVNAQAATAAKVRVIISATDGQKIWATVGVDENIIEASCHALLDSLEYLLQRKKHGQ